MTRVAIVSGSSKEGEGLTAFLKKFGRFETVLFQSATEAKQRFLKENFSIIIISTPLKDEFGYDFAVAAARHTISGIVFICKSSMAMEFSNKLMNDGVFVVSKPLDKATFSQTLQTAMVTNSRMSSLQNENFKLQKKLEEMKIINRAKYLLVEKMRMTEEEAHKTLEQEAMKQRLTKLELAKEIIENYSV